MWGRLARLATAVATVLVSVLAVGQALGVATSTASLSASGLSACTTTSGVLVTVDFSYFGGSVDLGCAAGSPDNGLDAMHQAGFLTAGDEQDGDAYVCRIGVAQEGPGSERPTPAEDPCVSTPPATAYWSLWVADAGQRSWDYSQFGATSYTPPPGSIEGWSFGPGRQPGMTPAQVRAEASASRSSSSSSTTTPTTTSTTTLPAPVRPTGGLRHRPRPHLPRRHRPRRYRPRRHPPRPEPGSTTTTLAPTATTLHPHVVVVSSGGGEHPPGGSGGSATGVLATVAIVVVMAATGGAFAWRRRRAA